MKYSFTIIYGVFLLILGVSVMLVSPSSYSAQTGDSFEATMSGLKSVPSVKTNMSGVVELVPDKDNTVSYSANVSGDESITTITLHCGSKNENGTIISYLFGKNSDLQVSGNITLKGTVKNIEDTASQCSTKITSMDEMISELRKGNIYANVATNTHTKGSIRGQLVPKTEEIKTIELFGTDITGLINFFKGENTELRKQLNGDL